MKVRRPSISLTNAHPHLRPNLAKFKMRLKHIERQVYSPVDIVLISDKKIASLAERFRNSPCSTDVLTFCSDDVCYASDVIISLDTAKRQARERAIPLQDELTLLVVHGLAHLNGQGDESYRDWCRMRRIEFETMMRVL